jgi:hypothetical protein
VSDRIVLTIPADSGFDAVAQLVLGGVAARLNLTYENLDDLGTALETLLERREDGALTVELDVDVDGDAITTTLGPLGEHVLAELERDDGGVGLRRVLETVTDSFEPVARDGRQWIQLRKSVDRAAGAS